MCRICTFERVEKRTKKKIHICILERASTTTTKKKPATTAATFSVGERERERDDKCPRATKTVQSCSNFQERESERESRISLFLLPSSPPLPSPFPWRHPHLLTATTTPCETFSPSSRRTMQLSPTQFKNSFSPDLGG